MNLNESIIKIRVELQNAKLKKSGKNKFAGFDYFELYCQFNILPPLLYNFDISLSLRRS